MKTKKNNIIHKDFKKIAPQTLYNLFGSKNIAIVNSLDEDIFINKKPMVTHCCYGKDFINKNNEELNKFNLIIVYCANYTCSAAHTYATKLYNKNKSLKNKILLYEGGIHEWAMYSMLLPDKFTIINNKTQTNLSIDKIQHLFNDYKHWLENQKNTEYPPLVIKNQHDMNLLDYIKSNSNNNNTGYNLMNNKVCVVTGGTSGLGLAVVKKMLDYGARHVTLTYYHDKERAKKVNDELCSKYGSNRVYVLRADARTIEGNKLTFDTKLRKEKLKLDVGPINCVDINAGIFGPANYNKKHIHNISEEDYEATMNTNLNGYFLSLKYFTKQAIDNELSDAAAVCIKSIYGSSASLFSNIAYQTSKHGVMGLVRQSAIELSRPNVNLKIKFPIRVNAVSPTFAETNLTKSFLDHKDIGDVITSSNPLNHLAYKNDIAEAVIYLLSDKSKSVTGIDLPVDCGVLAESIPSYNSVYNLNNLGIEELSCCGDKI